MKNKKVIIAIVIVLVLVVGAVAGVLIFKPFDKEEEDKDVDYEAILEKFLDACKSQDDMDKFVEDYVDIESMYVADQVDGPSDFEDEDSMEALYDSLKEKEDEADDTTNSTDDSDENVTNTSNKVSNKTTSSAYSDDEE